MSSRRVRPVVLLSGAGVAVIAVVVLGRFHSAGAQRDRGRPAGSVNPGSTVPPERPSQIAGASSERTEPPATLPRASPTPPPAQPSPLSKLDECMQSSLDHDELSLCIAGLDLRSVGASEFGRWMCSRGEDFRRIYVVAEARVSQLDPVEVLPFIDGFQSACGKYSETGLTVGGLQYGRYLSRQWYEQVAQTVDAVSLLPEEGSDALVQLAESFVRDGDRRIAELVQDIGTGASGGTSRQVFRAALVSVVCMSDPVERLEYLHDVYRTAGAEYGELGNLFAEWLCNGQCSLDGNVGPALRLLEDVLHDPRFESACAAQLAGFQERSMPGPEAGSWASILDHANTVRRMAQ